MVSKGAALTIQDGGDGGGNSDLLHCLHRVCKAKRRPVVVSCGSYLGSDLVATLAGLDVDNFSHVATDLVRCSSLNVWVNQHQHTTSPPSRDSDRPTGYGHRPSATTTPWSHHTITHNNTPPHHNTTQQHTTPHYNTTP